MRSCEPTVVRWRSMASDGARDGGRKADAVLGVPDVVVHRLGDRDHLDAELVERGGVAQRVVAADGDQVVEPQRSPDSSAPASVMIPASCRLLGKLSADQERRAASSSSTDWCGWSAGWCRRCGRWCGCCRDSAAECSALRLAGSSRLTCVRPSQPRRMPMTSQSFSVPR